MAKLTIKGSPKPIDFLHTDKTYVLDDRGSKWNKYRVFNNDDNIREAIVNSIIDGHSQLKDGKIELISDLILDIEDIKIKAVKSITATITFILSDNETNK